MIRASSSIIASTWAVEQDCLGRQQILLLHSGAGVTPPGGQSEINTLGNYKVKLTSNYLLPLSVIAKNIQHPARTAIPIDLFFTDIGLSFNCLRCKPIYLPSYFVWPKIADIRPHQELHPFLTVS
jgi:hypothetical protein